MIDISDGLAADEQHMCEESHCGAVLRAEAIPITAAAQGLHDGRSPLEHALGDGEDFELVFAVAPDVGRSLLQAQPVPGITLVPIGECVEQGLWLEESGQRRPLESSGYVHRLE
jgi:thiamine-monophosphate kinase